jgi:CubicO group peptidase (beta-lactamase class C family)
VDRVAATPGQEGLDSHRLGAAMAVIDRISGPDGSKQCVVVRNGHEVWCGPDVDHRRTVWSCTKGFLSTVLGLLIDDGRCSLDIPAADIHPPLAGHYPAMTLRHLATMTSGYRPRAASSTVPPLEPSTPLFAPGERFHYSWDPYLLALLLTRVAGESLRDLFRRRVAEPIGLDPASWEWGDWGPLDSLTGLPGTVVCGGSGLFDRGISITARAMARIGWLYACGGRWRDRQIISRGWVEAATQPQVAATVPCLEPGAWYARLPGRYGFYWWVNGLDAAAGRLWPSAPAETFAMQGYQDNYCFVIPPWQMVVVRLGTDGGIVNDRYDELFAALADAVGDTGA